MNEKKPFWKREIKAFEKLDLKKRFPDYFHKKVFQISFIIMLLIVVIDFILNGYSFYNLQLDCPLEASEGCENPLYTLKYGQSIGVVSISEGLTNLSTYTTTPTPPVEIPDYLCPNNICEVKTLSAGFHYGRKDFLSKLGGGVLFLILALAFITNHLVYYFKTGNIIYKRK